MKARHIICLVVGALTLFLAVKATLQPDEQKKAIEDAIYLDSPKVMSENEGKPIIICGQLKMEKGCYDDQFHITLNTPVAARNYEVEEQDADGAYSWELKDTNYFLGKATLGEFTLSDSMLLLIHPYDNYVAFDPNEIAVYHPQTSYGKTYLPIGLYERISYAHCDLEKNGEVTLVGKQIGNTIDVCQVSVAVNDGIKTKRRLLQEQKSSLIFGLIIGYAASLGLLLYGLSPFFRKREDK